MCSQKARWSPSCGEKSCRSDAPVPAEPACSASSFWEGEGTAKRNRVGAAQHSLCDLIQPHSSTRNFFPMLQTEIEGGIAFRAIRLSRPSRQQLGPSRLRPRVPASPGLFSEQRGGWAAVRVSKVLHMQSPEHPAWLCRAAWRPPHGKSTPNLEGDLIWKRGALLM